MIETGPNQVNPATTINFDPLYRNIFPSGTLYRFPPRVRKRLHYEYRNRCAICGRYGGCQCHHIVPQALGGAQKDLNGVLLCPDCHHIADSMIELGLVLASREEGQVVPKFVNIENRMNLCGNLNRFTENKPRMIKCEQDLE